MELLKEMLWMMVIAFLLFDAKYKNGKILQKIIPFFTLDKMMFKKENHAAGKKITMAYFFLSGAVIIQILRGMGSVTDYSSSICVAYKSGYSQAYEDIYGAETVGATEGMIEAVEKALAYAEPWRKDIGDMLRVIGTQIVIIVLWWFILRLVFEFIVIPIAQRPRVPVQYQSQIQQPPMQGYSNMQQPVQQMPVTLLNIQTKAQDLGVTNSATDTESFAFCSQCGTKYNTSAGNCPKCGMK